LPRTEDGAAIAERLRLAVRAPAKINLALHVTGRRADGYHDLDSLVIFTEMGDTLAIEDASADSFVIEGPFGGSIPGGGDNLVLRARDLWRKSRGETRPVALALTKNLPPASGIGGGSSDGAACLAGMTELFGSGFTLSAEALGADVPMCLAAEPLVARGIGDRLSPLASFPALSLVLVNPGVEVPTPEIFRRLASADNPPLPDLARVRTAAEVAAWLTTCRNDLEAPAISYAPVISDVLAALRAQNAALARMTGSGATCFGIFADMAAARHAAERLQARQPSWFVKATRSYAPGEFKRRIDP
jgi:4-diphosphocytidyl-2-C-methyl-D-erythritol kinase